MGSPERELAAAARAFLDPHLDALRRHASDPPRALVAIRAILRSVDEDLAEATARLGAEGDVGVSDEALSAWLLGDLGVRRAWARRAVASARERVLLVVAGAEGAYVRFEAARRRDAASVEALAAHARARLAADALARSCNLLLLALDALHSERAPPSVNGALDLAKAALAVGEPDAALAHLARALDAAAARGPRRYAAIEAAGGDGSSATVLALVLLPALERELQPGGALKRGLGVNPP